VDGRLPFWSDTLEGGSSPWANPQAGVLSPLQMAVRAFPIQHLLLGELFLKLLVAFEGTWLLARLTGRSRPASLLAAAGFSLGGGLFAWALFPITATVAWVPWLAAGVIRLFRHPGPRGIAVTVAITAALLLSGHPETAAFGGLFAAVCGLGLRRRAAGLGRGFGALARAPSSPGRGTSSSPCPAAPAVPTGSSPPRSSGPGGGRRAPAGGACGP
jgi:hypothetical protein